VDLLNNLYSLTSEKWIPEAMYTITQNAKAADLQSELARNRMLLSSSLGDSLHQRQSVINSQTTAYRYLINEENKGERPDSAKISRLKDDLFELDRERERVNDQIEKKFPQYHGSSEEFGLVSVDEIRKRLKRGEVVLNYLLSNRFEEGKRKLYTFVLTKHRLDIRESYLDTLFASNARIIEKSNDQSMMEGGKGSDYRANTGALWYMYANLIRPVEGLIKGRRLIIIPDEEISRLPFEAFIRELPEAGMSDYEGLKYLIRDYSFSYAYASAQVVLRESQREGPVKVYAFSPDYGDKSQKVKDTRSLEGANREISSIYRWFHGRSYSENSATLTNFRQIVHNPAVIHLAMHSYSDEANSSYSYLLFDNRQDTTNGGRLYNYEISVIRVNSPMVVLSACNSGSGTLYQGEGLLSIARSFMLAGATSVINTAWEINDDASAGIITRFYYHLSKGDPKDEAMRLAKLDYLKNSPTVYANPYYWASYKVTGSVQALRARVPNKYVMILFLAVVAGSAAFLLYLRRRRILSALP
jgi:CHAT domain-containing protein